MPFCLFSNKYIRQPGPSLHVTAYFCSPCRRASSIQIAPCHQLCKLQSCRPGHHVHRHHILSGRRCLGCLCSWPPIAIPWGAAQCWGMLSQLQGTSTTQRIHIINRTIIPRCSNWLQVTVDFVSSLLAEMEFLKRSDRFQSLRLSLATLTFVE